MAADKSMSPFQIIVLSEFTHTAPMESHSLKVFHGSCAYEMIIRLDIMCKVNFKIDFETNLMNCMFITVPMHASNYFDDTMGLCNVSPFDTDILSEKYETNARAIF